MKNYNPDLRTLFWEATLNCNAFCPFCSSRCGRDVVPEIDGNIVIKTFEKIAESYDASQIMINVTGGEPLLRKDLFDVMNVANQLGFPWGIVTNGSLISNEIIDKMESSGMKTISVSLDNLYEKHDSVRELPGSFVRIINAIKELANRNFLEYIQITTVVNKLNIHDIFEMRRYFSELPINSWRLIPADPIGRCKGNNKLLLDKYEFNSLIRFLRRYALSDKYTIETGCSHYLDKDDTLFRHSPFQCNAGRTVASILADGSIYVCPDVPRKEELIQGNIQFDDFIEKWENGFQFFRNSEARKVGKCAKCAEWEKCHGDSLHTWDFENQKPNFCIKDFEIDAEDLNTALINSQNALKDVLKITKGVYNNLTGYRISYGSSSITQIVFMPSASEQLHCLFHWGKHHPENECEQIAAAVGYSIGVFLYVEGIIPLQFNGSEENRSFYTDEMFKYVSDELAVWKKQRKQSKTNQFSVSDATFSGFIFTRPGNMSLKMSSEDIKFLNESKSDVSEPIFTGIINPHTRDLAFYVDSVFSPCDVLLLMERDDLKKWTDK